MRRRGGKFAFWAIFFGASFLVRVGTTFFGDFLDKREGGGVGDGAEEREAGTFWEGGGSFLAGIFFPEGLGFFMGNYKPK